MDTDLQRTKVYNPDHHSTPEPRMYVPGRMLMELWCLGIQRTNGGTWRHDLPPLFDFTDVTPWVFWEQIPHAMMGRVIRFEPTEGDTLIYRVAERWIPVVGDDGALASTSKWRWLIAFPD